MATHFFGLNDRTYRYSHTIGREAFNGGPGFYQLTDLAVGKDGVIYVVNRGLPERENAIPGIRVVMCTVDEEYLGDFGSFGEGDGQFIAPSAIALDSEQNVYLSACAADHLGDVERLVRAGVDVNTANADVLTT